jgi:DNA-binding GntR family transcriptional regulator
MPAPAQTNSKSTEAYDALKRLIDDGKLRDGDRITEWQASKMLGMGRGPAREAILRLQAEGIIHQKGVGTCRVIRYVEDEEPAEYISRLEVREQIAAGAVRLAARNMNGHQIEKLVELAERVQKEIDRGDIRRRNAAGRSYWDFLIANCGNKLLEEIWRDYQLTLVDTRSLELDKRIREQLPVDEQRHTFMRRLTKAIAGHDADAAEEIVHKTLRTRTRNIRRVLVDAPNGEA